tara:strand:+ start:53 stop:595 length:543 start_codon:yes stop_codon:yes gene_type:complete
VILSKREKKLKTTITYLQMKCAPTLPPLPNPSRQYALMKLDNPTVQFYRYLYSGVGHSWLWWERNVMPDKKLESIISDKAVYIFALYIGGQPGGYFELDYRNEPEMELAYFGLFPEFIGKGFGAYLLKAAILEAWSNNLSRFWVHTCNLDHPNALRLYQRFGFEVYNQEVELINEPKMNT